MSKQDDAVNALLDEAHELEVLIFAKGQPAGPRLEAAGRWFELLASAGKVAAPRARSAHERARAHPRLVALEDSGVVRAVAGVHIHSWGKQDPEAPLPEWSDTGPPDGWNPPANPKN